MSARVTKPHEHRWEFSGVRVFDQPTGIWISSYACACGTPMVRHCGGERKKQ